LAWLGVCGVISAFNFPVAVWSWNAALAFFCGDPVVWKPSEKTPLTALATQAVVERAMRRFGDAPADLSAVLIGGRDVGEALVEDGRVAVLSATGSIAMGRVVGPRLATRFARAILELGGNNAAIVAPSAELDLAVRAIAFAAMGSAGQRCTTLRRLFVHANVYDRLVSRLFQVYASVNVGDPRQSGTLVGPPDRSSRLREHAAGASRGARGRRYRAWWRAHRGNRWRERRLRASGSMRDAGACWSRTARDVCADSLGDAPFGAR
jgi:L-aminoadipate-semialdehyde dehydrogenase